MQDEYELIHTDIRSEKVKAKDVEYLVKKANRLGLLGKEIVHTYEVSEKNGCEYYFEVRKNSFLIETEHA